MDSFERNKVFGAVLAALLVIVAARNVAGIIFTPEAADPKAFEVELASTTTAGNTPAVEVDIATLLQTASASAGERSAKKCISCHSFARDGANKIGPALWGVVGRQIGSHPDFNYSKAMRGFAGVWSDEVLNGYLKNPKAYIKGTNMAFVGLRKDQERANVIAYLRSLK